MTILKRLMGSGFYGQRLGTKNLWASDLFNQLTEPKNFLISEMATSYKGLFDTKAGGSQFSGKPTYSYLKTPFLTLSYFEESFF